MKSHLKIILLQLLFIFVISLGVYYLYPRAEANVNGDWVKFNSINAKVIVISENPDFLNPRYIEFDERKNYSFNLKPGTYYWKPDNGLIEGVKNKFTIDSEVSMKIEKNSTDSDLVNIGNVKISVKKNQNGMMVGNIILEPEGSEKIENLNESYEAREVNSLK
ncbi:MAG: hypothetical protein Q8N99_01775 [Nanoarchaeota archaeon]|nr:hypothetical protein [Nanoarchaeota archaeon]